MKSRIIILASLALIASFSSAGDDAEKWLEKVAAVYAKAPLTIDYRADMDINQMGMQMNSKMSGTITFKDKKHQRMELKVKMNMGGNDMDMTMTTVNDGKTMWVDSNMPMMRQVSKMDLTEAEEMMKEAGLGNMAGGGMSMGQLVESMKESMDVTVASIKDGKVTLNAVYKEMKVDPESPMAPAVAQRQDTRMVMILDEKNIFPMEMQMFTPKDAEKAGMVMHMENLKYVKEADLPADVFSFTPPEGVQVIDMGEQYKAAKQQGHGHKH